ncbi:MAG: FAD binding domain-containing protein [Marinosulfonomonas sp.]|nr:FAD binding domain-containing protein [Marinosulfonomonas sp.]
MRSKLGYIAAETLEMALHALGGSDVAVVAGCTDWFPALGGKPAPGTILDVTGIPGFRGINKADGGWHIGAATRWSDIVAADLPPGFDGLKAAAREVGSVQIQNAATIAGNLCNASPAADGVPPLLTLDARIEIASLSGARNVPLAEFITGVRTTSLQPDELVTGLSVPDLPTRTGASFVKLGARKYLVISIAMVSAVITFDEGERVSLARVAVGACSPVAQRLGKLEKALLGMPAFEVESGNLPIDPFLSPLAPIGDVRGSAEYRMEVAADLCRRAIASAAATAHG